MPEPSDDALVLRFPPGGIDELKKIRKEAKYVHRHHQPEGAEPWYRLSVWATDRLPDESEAELRTRLVRAAGLHLDLEDERNDVFWWSRAGTLRSAGFVFKKDGYDAEPEEHYSVDLGEEEPTREIVLAFANAFIGYRREGT